MKNIGFGLGCLALGGIGYYAASSFSRLSNGSSKSSGLLSLAGSPLLPATPATAHAAIAPSSAQDLATNSGVSFLSSAMDPGFVDFLFSSRVQLGLQTSDVDMIEARLTADLPTSNGGPSYGDTRENEIAARYTLLRALHRAHVEGGVEAALVPRLAEVYKRVLQTRDYSLHFRAQALRNLAAVGIGGDELARDNYLAGVDPRIHRLAAMDEIQDLGTEE